MEPVSDLISDEELAAEAMAAEPVDPFAADAVRFDTGMPEAMQLLPDWYMPAPSLRRSRGRVIVLSTVAISLAVGNVVGFCVTFGVPQFVWG